jgi:hypothetical protein
MSDMGFWDGIWHELSTAGRFRLFLQPSLAIVLGIRLGVADARAGHPPFLARLVRSPHERWRLVWESMGHAAAPLTLALVMDSIFQYLALGRIRILAALVVGILLVWLPFSSVRGLANRAWTHRRRRMERRAARSTDSQLARRRA